MYTTINPWLLFMAVALAMPLGLPEMARGGDNRSWHLDRVALYEGWKFEYSSTYVLGESRVDLENVLVLGGPHRPGSVVIRRLWSAYRKNPGRRYVAEDVDYVLHSFAGFNGQQGRTYERVYPEGLGTLLRSMPYSKGRISVNEPFAEYTRNMFERFLTAGPHGVTQASDPDGRVAASHPFSFEEVGRGSRLGIPVIILSGSTDKSHAWRTLVEVSDTPERLTLRSAGEHEGRVQGGEGEVTRVDDFEGILYPAEGKSYSPAVGGVPRIEYRFHVNKVERARQADYEWPEWPVGTVVSDFTKPREDSYATITTVEFPAGFLADVERPRIGRAPVSRSRVIFWIANAIAVIALTVVVWMRLKRR